MCGYVCVCVCGQSTPNSIEYWNTHREHIDEPVEAVVSPLWHYPRCALNRTQRGTLICSTRAAMTSARATVQGLPSIPCTSIGYIFRSLSLSLPFPSPSLSVWSLSSGRQPSALVLEACSTLSLYTRSSLMH